MSVTDVLNSDSLRAIPLFQGFNTTDYSQMLDVMDLVPFGPDRLILQQGGTSCEVSRRLELDKADSKRVVLAMLEPPSHFGDMSFFSPSPHSADVKAVTAVRLLRIKHTDYRDQIDEGVQAAYKLAYNVTESLVRRLRRMDDWVTELAVSTPAHEQAHRPEWQNFREKLFDRWNL